MPLDDDRITIAGLFFEAHAGLAHVLGEALEQDCELPAQWFEVLIRIGRSPEGRLRMADLAAQVALSPSGLTRAVDRLEAAGLVARTECPNDRRGAYTVLTEAGRQRLSVALPVHLEHLDRHLVAALTPEELESFSGALRKLRDHVNPSAAQVTAPS